MLQQCPDFRANACRALSLMVARTLFFQEADEENADEHPRQAKQHQCAAPAYRGNEKTANEWHSYRAEIRAGGIDRQR